MTKSTRHFLEGIIDYAGLYPPANLNLEEAFAKYLKHGNSPHQWMLSRFVAGQNLLEDLAGLINKHGNQIQDFPISVVAAPSNSLDEFQKVVEKVSVQATKIVKATNGKAQVPSLEIKFPDESLSDSETEDFKCCIDFAVNKMSDSSILPREIFFEIPGFEFDEDVINKVVKAIKEHNSEIKNAGSSDYSFSGFKIRCGGVEAFQFPDTNYLALSISKARSENVPMKFTAGLHHPIRHFNDSVNTKMHGFINVFGAGFLCYANELSKDEVRLIIEEENPASFSFSDSAFSWKDKTASTSDIKKLRATNLLSYGSCSFEEPVEDLIELKLLT